MDPMLPIELARKKRVRPSPVNGGFHRDTFSDPAGRDRRRLYLALCFMRRLDAARPMHRCDHWSTGALGVSFRELPIRAS
jgi:hypothetical protein